MAQVAETALMSSLYSSMNISLPNTNKLNNETSSSNECVLLLIDRNAKYTDINIYIHTKFSSFANGTRLYLI